MTTPATKGYELPRDPVLWTWALFIFFYPIYIAPSGMPQPADILIIALTPILFRSWDGRLPFPMRRAVIALLGFTLYVVASNLLWSVLTGTFAINLRYGFLLSPLFYVYNALVFLLALIMYKQRGQAFIDITVRAVLVTAIVQVPLSILIGRSTSLRSSGMFNAPNQLGYFAVLSASIILLGQRRARLSTTSVVIGILACMYLALVSASKAALVSAALIILISTISRLKTVLMASVVAVALLLWFDPLGNAVDRTMRRIETDDSYGFIEERGYDRIANNPQYWLFGAGEGGYMRFSETTMIKSHELHSSGGTIFFCYGIVGAVLFLAFGFQVLRVTDLRQILLVLPVAAYGLSHQGLRVTYFWVFLGLLLMVGRTAAIRAGPVTRPVTPPVTPPGPAPERSQRPSPAA